VQFLAVFRTRMVQCREVFVSLHANSNMNDDDYD